MLYIGEKKENTSTSNYFGRVKTKIQDSYETPLGAWEDILQHIPKNTLIYDPFYFNGATTKHLNKLGFQNVYHKNEDAFKNSVPNSLVITNPPYSIKSKCLEYYNVCQNKVAMLLPMDTMERKYFQKYINNFQLVVPSVRYNYCPGKKGQSPFKSCWFCWNLQEELGTTNQIVWMKSTLEKEKKD